MTTEQARALGILAGLQGEPAVWRHTAAAYPKFLVAWQQGHVAAVTARAAEQQQERTKTQAQARQQGVVALSGGALFGDGVPQRIWGKARVVPLSQEPDQQIAQAQAERERIPGRLDIALRKASAQALLTEARRKR